METLTMEEPANDRDGFAKVARLIIAILTGAAGFMFGLSLLAASIYGLAQYFE